MSQNLPLGRHEDAVKHRELLLKAAHVLHGSGQETEETIQTLKTFGQQLAVSGEVLMDWGSVTLQSHDATETPVLLFKQTVPSTVAMNRVEAINRAIWDTGKQSPLRVDVSKSFEVAEHLEPAPLWLFVVACVTGAVSLSVIFGAVHVEAVGMIALGAAIGALFRRLLSYLGGGAILQALVASIIAGLIGALAVKLNVSSELRLVAVCQCMILVPGPHILNGVLDLTYLRIPLGVSRLVFAGLILVAICTGILLGLHLGGSDLPVDAPGRHVALWLDILAAGGAAASYTVYFSTPLSMLVWPIVTGMVAHAARWYAMTVLGFGAASAAGIACVITAACLIPVASRRKLPFAAIGFASVVSLMPGIFIFRTSSGVAALYQHFATVTPDVLRQTLADATTAVAIVLCMGLGLVLPKRLYGALVRSYSRKGIARV